MPESAQEMDSLPIPGELLAEILLSLPSPADLVRASAVCVSFHRVVADRSFLRRYRKLHAPPILGFLNAHKGFQPADLPYPSASAAKAVALVADFTFSFLPGSNARKWDLEDVRDGRVLLDRFGWRRSFFMEMVVCDPLHRRYLMLPPIPEDLAASLEDMVRRKLRRHWETFLAPHGDEDEMSFSVIWMVQCPTKLTAFVFSSSTGQWRAVAWQSWSDLFDGSQSWTRKFSFFNCRQYAYGCFYWLSNQSEKLLVLDTRRMEFSTVDRPNGVGSSVDINTVEGREGITGMFVLPDRTPDLSYFIRRNNGRSSVQWQLEKTISLSPGPLYTLADSVDRCLLLIQWGNYRDEPNCFTLDTETFQLTRICNQHSGHAYSNFPPLLLSSPTVSSGTKEELMEQGAKTT